MKLWIKILIAILIILLLFSMAAYIFVVIKGKALLVQKLQDVFKKEVSVGQLGVKIPLNIEIRDLKIKELANISYIYVSPSIFGLLRGGIILNEVMVLRPEVSWQRRLSNQRTIKNNPTDNPTNNMEISRALAQTKQILNSPRVREKQVRPIIIKYLSVKDGEVNFYDRTIAEPGIQITLKNVSLDINNLYLYPKSAFTDFQLEAKIPWQEGQAEGMVFASGWMNLYKKDMQARLEIEGIDGVYLHPYYAKWVDLENARIKEAVLNLTSDIQSQNNDLIAKCRLELTDIKFRPRPPEESEHRAEKITTVVLGIFRALNQGRVVLNFTIRTKMDRPEFKFDTISSAVDKTISQAIEGDKVSIEDVATLPGRIVEGMTKGATEATKAIIDSAVSVGKSILDVFTTESEPEETELQQEDFLGD
jgi:hypothetical protein